MEEGKNGGMEDVTPESEPTDTDEKEWKNGRGEEWKTTPVT